MTLHSTLLTSAALALMTFSADAQIGASQNRNNNSPKVTFESSEFKTDEGPKVVGGSELKTDKGPTFHNGSEFKQEGSGFKVEGGSKFKQDGGSTIEVKDGSLKLDDVRPVDAKRTGKSTTKLPPSEAAKSGNLAAEQNTQAGISEGGLELSKAKCEAKCKNKYYPKNPLKSAIDNSLKSPLEPSKSDPDAEMKKQQYEACLTKCPK